MSSVKEAIEAMIEASYLRGLSEEEIRRDFDHFIDTCCGVVEANVGDEKAVSNLSESLAREKDCIPIGDQIEAAGPGGKIQEEGEGKSSHERFVEKVAFRKRVVLKKLADYDPKLVRLVDERRYQGEPREEPRVRIPIGEQRNWEQNKLLLLKLGYVGAVVLVILLVYMGFIQRP